MSESLQNKVDVISFARRCVNLIAVLNFELSVEESLTHKRALVNQIQTTQDRIQRILDSVNRLPEGPAAELEDLITLILDLIDRLQWATSELMAQFEISQELMNRSVFDSVIETLAQIGEKLTDELDALRRHDDASTSTMGNQAS